VFRFDPNRPYVNVPQERISALYQSQNNAPVALPGQPAALAKAIVIGYKLDARLFGVMIALHLLDSGRHLIFAHEDKGLDPMGARTAAQEAIAFVEAMGFLMENVKWRDVPAAARADLLGNLKVFDPPVVTNEEPKVLDPRTKLARLLVQL
jgi:hypothetical protein